MAIQYLNTKGITETCKAFRSNVKMFDQCVTDINSYTNQVEEDWIGEGKIQFETQMRLMMSQLEDISQILYDICEALKDAEAAYIDADVETAKQINVATGGGRANPDSSAGERRKQ